MPWSSRVGSTGFDDFLGIVGKFFFGQTKAESRVQVQVVDWEKEEVKDWDGE
jgi:hypothetical protein